MTHPIEQLQTLVTASTAVNDWLEKNVGDSADWPARILAGSDVANELCDLLSTFSRSVEACRGMQIGVQPSQAAVRGLDAFAIELDSLIRRYKAEADLTFADVVGVLAMKQFLVMTDAKERWDRQNQAANEHEEGSA